MHIYIPKLPRESSNLFNKRRTMNIIIVISETAITAPKIHDNIFCFAGRNGYYLLIKIEQKFKKCFKIEKKLV